MPFQSESQRRFMWAKHPEIADAWAHGRSSVTGKKEGKRKKHIKKFLSKIRGEKELKREMPN